MTNAARRMLNIADEVASIRTSFIVAIPCGCNHANIVYHQPGRQKGGEYSANLNERMIVVFAIILEMANQVK